jgi:two-component SAPR family response regulator
MELTERKILIVEDEPLVGLEIATLLAEKGAIPIGPVQTVTAALQLMDKTPVDCAVLNIELRGERSFPIADALSARHVPFAFITSYGESAIPSQHKDRPLVQKPFLEPRVLETVMRLLRRE